MLSEEELAAAAAAVGLVANGITEKETSGEMKRRRKKSWRRQLRGISRMFVKHTRVCRDFSRLQSRSKFENVAPPHTQLGRHSYM